jgi:DNA repair protein RecN (Recombination protein N)
MNPVGLRRLVLRDFVIVHELELELGRGMTVLTGETGAGKSILIDALQLALGNRADAAVVREGANRAEVSAEFDTSEPILRWLEEAGLDGGDSLLLRRTVDGQGKSRAWINGSPATATQLRALGEQLLDIHGQHAWQSLARPESVRQLLDDYAGIDGTSLPPLWQAWRDASRQLTQAQAAQATLQETQERLHWQMGELNKLAPGAEEWPELNSQHTRLSHAQALLDAAQSAILALEDEAQGGLRALSRAREALQEQSDVEPGFTELVNILSTSLAQAEDAAHTLHAYLRRAEPDPEHLHRLDERLTHWMSLARRFKCPPAELPVLLQSWRQELAQLALQTDLDVLSQAEQHAAAAWKQAALDISQRRHQAAPRLARAVTHAMQGLGMQGGRFEVTVNTAPEPMASGLDDIAFLVAGHAGSTPRAVNKVASGGELSRLALAIAVSTSQLGSAHTLIFDEVDSGVGGAVAETVGRLMKQLGRDRQVLAVTHLPQVAACADTHLVVSKRLVGASVQSMVQAVQGQARTAEVARMLGGENLSTTTLAHAKEMLQG